MKTPVTVPAERRGPSVSAPPRFSATVERNVPVPMRDGTTLYADVWRPSEPGRYPVLLQRLPYDKSVSQISVALSGLEPLRAVGRGYAVVIQDTRGRFASEGEFRVFEHEARDGADTIEWAARQPFSNGNVGMYGSSYVGATQFLAAGARPPALKAIVPLMTASEYYEGWTYQGGAFQLGLALLWGIKLAAVELLRRDDWALRAAWLELARDPWSAYRKLPLTDQPVINELLPSYAEWLAHPERDAFWQAIAPGAIGVPALHINGWNGIFLGGTLQSFLRLGGHLIVGPWGHGVTDDVVGEAEYGPLASQAAIDLTAIHLDWFDAFLPDGAPGRFEGPPIRLFVMGANDWRDEEAWPPPGARQLELHLRRGGHLTESAPDEGEPPDEFTYDPRDPVPTIGGQTYLPGVRVGRFAGPRGQREVEARPDVLVYTSEPLERDTELTGPVSVVLHAATSGPDTDWTAKLCDVYPDGRSLGLTDGIVRARYRNGTDRAELLEPGEVYLYEIDLVATSIVLPAGHRVRLQVSSSNFPRFDRNPNHGGTIATATEDDLRPARQTVFHDACRPSRLRLSVVGTEHRSGA